MIHFFGNESNTVFAVQSQTGLSADTVSKLNWLFGDAHQIEKSALSDFFCWPARRDDYSVEYQRRRNYPEHGYRWHYPY
jgi:hypothetical protein